MTTATRDDSGAAPTRVTDLRGRSAATADPILVDPTGRRARRLRLGGRLLAAVFSIWLCALVLAGLGGFPVDLRLPGGVRAGQAPPNVGSAPDPHSSHVTVSPPRVSAERRAQADSVLRHARTPVPSTNRSDASRRPVAGTPDARTRQVAKHGPSSVTSTHGSRRAAPPAGGEPGETLVPVSSSTSPTDSSNANVSGPGHQSGSTGSSDASASAPGHQSDPGGSSSTPGAGTLTTSSTGPGAPGSASDHAVQRTTGSGTSSG
jgi:hypothetical protein